MTESSPRLQAKVEVIHDERDGMSEDRLQDLIGAEWIEDIRISGGYRASAVFVTFMPGKYHPKRVDQVARWVARWMGAEGYADSVEVGRKWIGATGKGDHQEP